MAKTHNGAQETGAHFSFGIILGAVIGAALGVLLGNLALGVGIGIAVGAGVGGLSVIANDKKYHKHNNNKGKNTAS